MSGQSRAVQKPVVLTVAETATRQSFEAIVVLGTPVMEDLENRMVWALGLLHNRGYGVIVAVGNQNEAGRMEHVALDRGLSSSDLIVDGNSKTTVDNAYFAKKICFELNLKPVLLVTSQYQSWRAALTFRRVLGPQYDFRSSPVASQTTHLRRLRETFLTWFVPLLFLFKKGDDGGLKRASDLLWRLLSRPF